MIVTLLTDFGTVDGLVGAMKGVILSRCAAATLVDITHDVPPQDVRAGAWALREAAGLFPAGTIHVAVVDPGVGTARRPLLVDHGGQHFVGPDNGILTLAAGAGSRARVLDRPQWFRQPVSRTFHGRDVFAAVAGALAAGALPGELGSATHSWEQLPSPRAVSLAPGQLRGEVVHVDRFGNLVTSVEETQLSEQDWTVSLAGRSVGPVLGTFGDVAPGDWVAYIGSGGRLEVAVRESSAAAALGGRVIGTEVMLCTL